MGCCEILNIAKYLVKGIANIRVRFVIIVDLSEACDRFLLSLSVGYYFPMSSTDATQNVPAIDAAQLANYMASINELLRRISDTTAYAVPCNNKTSMMDDACDDYITTDDEGSVPPTRRILQKPPKVLQGGFRLRLPGGKKKEKAYYGSEEVKCPVCEKTLTASNIRHHMNMHLMYTKRPYPCEYCEKCFAYKKNFDRHMIQQHPEHFM